MESHGIPGFADRGVTVITRAVPGKWNYSAGTGAWSLDAGRAHVAVARDDPSGTRRENGGGQTYSNWRR